jgi:hypothetical protein
MRRSRLALVLPAALAVVAACAAPAPSEPEAITSTANQETCPPAEHECPAWGAVCSGSTLSTCVLDARGCRKKIEEPCALGCEAGACKTCSTFTSPVDATLAPAVPSFYRDVTFLDATTLVVVDEGRDGIYSKPRRALAWFRVPTSATTAPSALGTTPLPDNVYVRSVRGAAGKAVALVNDELRVWSAPATLSVTLKLGFSGTSLATAGSLAFVGDASGVTIVDVGVTPPVVRSVVATTVPAHALAAAAGRLAVAGDAAVEIYDLSDVTAPSLLAKATRAAKIYSPNASDSLIAFDGTKVYAPGSIFQVSYFIETLDVFELDTSAASPALLLRGSLHTAPPVAVSLQGGELVGRRGTRVGTLDVSNPAAPAWSKLTTLPVEPTAVVARGDHLFAVSTEGLTSLALAKTSSVRLVPRAEQDVSWAFAQKGSLGYVARAESGFSIEDLRDPKAPKVLSRTAMKTGGLALDGSLAYVSSLDALRVYDVRNPAAPALVGSVAAPGRTGGLVHVAGNRAYVVCGNGGVCVFDVTTPSAPTFLYEKANALAIPDAMAWAPFMMRGSLLYMGTSNKVLAFDMNSAGAAPSKVAEVALDLSRSYASFDYGYSDPKVGVDAARGVVAYGCGVPMARKVCVEVLDLANAPALQKRGLVEHTVQTAKGTYATYNPGNTVLRAEVRGTHAYVSMVYGGVVVVDLANPDAPRVIGEQATALAGYAAHETGNHLAVHTVQFGPGLRDVSRLDEVVEVCK